MKKFRGLSGILARASRLAARGGVSHRIAAACLFAALVLPAAAAAAQPNNPQAESTTISFQQGVSPTSDYQGAADTNLSQDQPDISFAIFDSLLVDGDDPAGSGKDKSILLAWNTVAIPPGSIVESASITLQITNPSNKPYAFYEIKRAWSEGMATWNQADHGILWQSGGALGPDDRNPAPLGAVVASTAGSYTFSFNNEGLAAVQSWVNAPETNHGIIIADPVNDDGLSLASKESTNPDYRPRLTITYRAAGSAAPAAAKSLVHPGPPKNVILLVGNGMGFELARASGIYAHGRAGSMGFESFPYRASLNGDALPPAAAAASNPDGPPATGLGQAAAGDSSSLSLLVEQLRMAGKRTGLVTTSPIGPDLVGEDNGLFSGYSLSGREADTLGEVRPNIVLGSGGAGLTSSQASADGYAVVTDRAGLQKLDLNHSEYVTGLFGKGPAPYSLDGNKEFPNLSELTNAALDQLEEGPNGFFLLVENNNIQRAASANDLPHAIAEVGALSDVSGVVLRWAAGHPDTLLILAGRHETGGLKVIQGFGAGQYPAVRWAGSSLTNAPTPVYATGANASLLKGTITFAELRDIIYGQQAIPAVPVTGFVPFPVNTASSADPNNKPKNTLAPIPSSPTSTPVVTKEGKPAKPPKDPPGKSKTPKPKPPGKFKKH